MGLDPHAPPEEHKAQMWALWHGLRITPGAMSGMNRRERLKALDDLQAQLDRQEAPSTIRLWQADLANTKRRAAGTAWLLNRQLADERSTDRQ